MHGISKRSDTSKAFLREGKRFGRIGGIEHGNMRGAGIKARILLILRGVHARVIGRENQRSRRSTPV